MLFKSGINLRESTINIISDSDSIILFSAYLKQNILQEINQDKKINQIVVRWEIKDLCLGVSDLELYHYCRANNITLYRNTRIHLKAIWNGMNKVVFGSANVTEKGIGESNNFNFELNGIYNNMSIGDRMYLQSIINSSEIVDEKLFNKIKEKVIETNIPTLSYPKIPTQKKDVDYFLLSQLPMFENPDKLFDYYSEREIGSDDNLLFALHDINLYNIPLGLNEEEFYITLTQNFNNHLFINTLKLYICSQPNKSLRYGGVVSWVINNTTSVPTPRSWEIKKDLIVNILFDWICFFDKSFKWDIPNYSQVIYCNDR